MSRRNLLHERHCRTLLSPNGPHAVHVVPGIRIMCRYCLSTLIAINRLLFPLGFPNEGKGNSWFPKMGSEWVIFNKIAAQKLRPFHLISSEPFGNDYFIICSIVLVCVGRFVICA